MATMTSIDHDKDSVEKVLRSIPRPELVKEPVVEFREDHTGDDAVFITFPVSKKIPLSPKRSKTLFLFVRQLEELLYEERLQRFPYIRFSETR